MDIAFSIPVTGVIRLDGDRVIITVNRAETTVEVPFPATSTQFSKLEPGQSMDAVILDAARVLVRNTQTNRFTGPELFETAIESNPRLNKRSFLSRVVAVTPTHPSYRHFASGKDYFIRIGRGLYKMDPRYLPDPITPALLRDYSE